MNPEILNAATAAYGAGRFDEAEQILNGASTPLDLAGMLLLGVIHAKRGESEEAIQLLTEILRVEPTAFDALYWLSSIHLNLLQGTRAVAYAERLVALHPNEPHALQQLGRSRIMVGDWVGAEASLAKAAKGAPHIASIHYARGSVLEELGRIEESARCYRRTLAIDPKHEKALHKLGTFSSNELDYRRAGEYAGKILALNPDSVDGHLLSAVALVGLGRPNEAKAHVSRMLELQPDNFEALTLAGGILQSLGDLTQSEIYLRRSIEIEPRQGYAYYALIRSRTLTEDDRPLYDQMLRVAEEPMLPRVHKGDLQFAIGKAGSDLRQYEDAMAHYNLANRYIREWRYGDAIFDPKTLEESTDSLTGIVDSKFAERYKSFGSEDALPIFVCGMMRSGTTLAEQILTSHPEIGGAGEQRFWGENRIYALDPPGNILNRQRFGALTEQYLRQLREIAPGKARVVDKMPTNYGHLGLIHIALPNARMIHIRRNPVDTCLSIWMTPNAARISWAHNKGWIVAAYKDYLRNMEHWRSMLPADRLLEIDYEELVADPEPVTRRMIEFVGMPWDDACLRPQDNLRPVATPSAWQVRQAVYTTSVERWRRYEPWLDEFCELLTP